MHTRSNENSRLIANWSDGRALLHSGCAGAPDQRGRRLTRASSHEQFSPGRHLPDVGRIRSRAARRLGPSFKVDGAPQGIRGPLAVRRPRQARRSTPRFEPTPDLATCSNGNRVYQPCNDTSWDGSTQVRSDLSAPDVEPQGVRGRGDGPTAGPPRPSRPTLGTSSLARTTTSHVWFCTALTREAQGWWPRQVRSLGHVGESLLSRKRIEVREARGVTIWR